MSKIQTLVVVLDGTQMKAFRLDEGRLHAQPDLSLGDKSEHRPQEDESHATDSVSEHGFVGRAAHRLDVGAAAFDRLVVAADPTSLGVFRSAASSALKAKVTAEIDRDYIHTPLPELEAALAKHMAGG